MSARREAVARRDFDVVISGGGMVGAALAALLVGERATQSLRVAVVEPRPADLPLPGEPLDLRVSALSRASQRLLRAVGAWPAVVARGACAYDRMLVWEHSDAPEGPNTLAFEAAEIGEPDLGHIVENRVVAAALLAAATRRGATLLRTSLDDVELEPDFAVAVTPDRRLTTRLVVAADGADSPARAWAGIGGTPEPYPQAAVVAHLRPEAPHGGAARQRFLADGPLALLPLADGRVSLVWSTTPEHAAQLVAVDDAAFGELVTTASDRVLGTLVPTTPRVQFPLRRFHAQTYARARFALAGDAAHAVHPLAGQGVNLGLLDAAALAEVLGDALANGEDPGDLRVLGRYSRWRRADNAVMGAALDGLYRLFANPSAWVGRARRSGLGLVNRSGPLKQFFVRQALGTGGDLPRLLAREAAE
ncbi:MAG: FAD-dependent monooxygenase [Steroidobacteraceae bacterium]|nr:FAD-dependent monooxygenase [Steroidobacteraceae bacterium]